MKSRLFCALIAAVLCPLLSATTTVTGTVRTLGTTVPKGTLVRFWLRGCKGNQPRVSGVAIFPANVNGQFYFDIPTDAAGTVTGTLYSTRAANGIDAGEIDCGGSRVAVWYGMQVFRNSVGGPEVPVHAKDTATMDVSNVTPISTTSVVAAPTGDATYLRLDGGNSPMSAPLSGPFTVNGALSVSNGTASLTSPGIFSNSATHQYVTSQIGSTDPATFFQNTQTGGDTDAFAGIVTVPAGATGHQFNGGNFVCISNAVSSPLGTWENCAGAYGVGVANVSNSAAWGSNFVAYDVAGTTGTMVAAYEADMGLFGAPKRFHGFFLTGAPFTGTMASGPVMGTIDVTNHSASAYGVALPPTSTAQFPVTFWSARGVAPIGLMLDAACFTGSCNSQSIALGSNNGSTALTATITEDTAGSIRLGAGATGQGVLLPQATFAGMSGSAANGTMLYCTDCKNVPDNAAVAGAACISGGNGTVARRDNNRWDCN